MHELTVTVDIYDIQNINVRVFVALSQFLLSAEAFDLTWTKDLDGPVRQMKLS